MNKIKEDECYEYYEALFESYKVSFKVEKNIKESIINLLMIEDLNDVDNLHPDTPHAKTCADCDYKSF